MLAAMGAFIPDAGGARGAAFAVAAAVLFAVLAVLWLLAARGDGPVAGAEPAVRHRDSGVRHAAGQLALLPADVRVLTWACRTPPTWRVAAVILASTPTQAAALIVATR